MAFGSRSFLSRLTNTAADWQARHQLRHQPSGFQFALADRIDYLNPAAWDEATASGGLFLRRSVLRAMESNGPANVSQRYALIYRQHTVVAALAVQRIDIEGKEAFPGAIAGESSSAADAKAETPRRKRDVLKKAVMPVVKQTRDRLSIRLLVAGNVMSWGFDGIAFAPGIDPTKVWPGVAEALYRIRRAEKLDGQAGILMVKDITPAQSHANQLHRFSYRPLETEPNMVLSLDPAWKSYDDYLGALDSKNRRSSKDQLKALAKANCVIERLEGLAAIKSVAPRLHELYLSVQGQAAVRLVALPEDYLPSLAEAAGEDFRCTVIRQGEAIVGFVTSLRSQDTAVGYYIGFDRQVAAAGAPLYLRLLHSTIADAIDWRCKRLSLGRTALYPKAGLGAKPEPMSVWLRHRVPAINWVVRSLLSTVPHDEAPERNPFKS